MSIQTLRYANVFFYFENFENLKKNAVGTQNDFKLGFKIFRKMVRLIRKFYISPLQIPTNIIEKKYLKKNSLI